MGIAFPQHSCPQLWTQLKWLPAPERVSWSPQDSGGGAEVGPFTLRLCKPVILVGLSTLLKSAGSMRALTLAHRGIPVSTAAPGKEHAGLYVTGSLA